MIPYENWSPPRHLPATASERATGRVVLLAIAALFLLLAFAATGCHTSRPVADTRPNAELVAPPIGVAVDSSTAPLPGIVVGQSTKSPGLLRRLFPAKSTAAASSTPRKCKGCTFNYVQGNQSTTAVGKKSTAAVGEGATSTSTTTGKKSGPAVIASDSVDLNSAGPNSQQVTTTGNGNQVDAKKQDTTKEAPGAWATFVDNLTGPLGYVLAGAAVLALLAWRAHRNNPMA